jgi:hypothetical protein
MEQNKTNKIELKDRLISFYNTNKIKIYTFIIFLIIMLISIAFIKISNENKNILIGNKYIKAGLYLTSGKKDQSKNLYEEIILSKNKFYSILALNKLLEKNLISDKDRILNYFKIIEKINISQEQRDLIVFKKALYLIKISNNKEGNQLLENLIKNKSKLNSLAKEILNK